MLWKVRGESKFPRGAGLAGGAGLASSLVQATACPCGQPRTLSPLWAPRLPRLLMFFFKVKNPWFLTVPRDAARRLPTPSCCSLSGRAEALRPGEVWSSVVQESVCPPPGTRPRHLCKGLDRTSNFKTCICVNQCVSFTNTQPRCGDTALWVFITEHLRSLS